MSAITEHGRGHQKLIRQGLVSTVVVLLAATALVLAGCQQQAAPPAPAPAAAQPTKAAAAPAPALAQPTAAVPAAAPAAQPTAAPAKAPVKVRLGWQRSDNVTDYVMQEQKLLEKRGLDPEWILFQSGPAIFPALQSKSIDFAILGATPALTAVAQGIDIKYVFLAAESDRQNYLMVRKESGIAKLSDLKGKKIGTTKGSSAYLGLLTALDSVGLKLSDINFVDISVGNLIPALQKGDVDGGWAWGSWAFRLQQVGGIPVTNNRQLGIIAPSMWTARTEWLQQNPEAAARVVAAFDDANQWARNNKEAAIETLTRGLEGDATTAKAVLADYVVPTMEEQLSSTYAASLTFGLKDCSAGGCAGLTKVAKFLVDQGALKTIPDLSKVLDPQYLQAAQKLKR